MVIGRRTLVLIFTLLITPPAFAWIRESPARLFWSVLTASKKPADGTAAAAGETGEPQPVE